MSYLVASVDCWKRALEAAYLLTTNIGLEAGASAEQIIVVLHSCQLVV
jgi:hypothetical protein